MGKRAPVPFVEKIYLLWQCSFWKGRVKDIPAQWHERLQAGTDPELWNRGMTQSLFYLPDGGMATFTGEGLWTDLETLPVTAGQAFSVAIAPTCRDPRHRRFVFAICIHNVNTKERVGSITGICPGKASRQRAFFYALKHLSLHINDKVQMPSFNCPPGNCGPGWLPLSNFRTYVKVWSRKTMIKFGFCSSVTRTWHRATIASSSKKTHKLRPPRLPFWLSQRRFWTFNAMSTRTLGMFCLWQQIEWTFSSGTNPISCMPKARRARQTARPKSLSFSKRGTSWPSTLKSPRGRDISGQISDQVFNAPSVARDFMPNLS